MFQTIAYKNGHIQTAYNEGKEQIIAKVTIPTKEKGQTVWDYRRKECRSLHSAKLWITKQESEG